MNTTNPIRILIVDDHDMLRRGLAAFLHAFPDMQLVGDTSSGIEAIRLCQELHPDVVLMDLLMPEMDGVTTIENIHQKQSEIKIIALSSYSEDRLVKAALRAGATSYILKNVSPEELAEAIRATQSGLPSLSPEVVDILIEPTQPVLTQPSIQEPLTQRELDVLAGMVAGLTNAQIAMQLKISQSTIKGYVSNILSKLGVKNRTEAVALALRIKLIPPE
jgi:two-component system, NarL family, response regulator LiaR